MRSVVFALAVVVSSTVACAPPSPAPTAADGAAHLGLGVGSTKTYASSTGASETHAYVASDILLADGLTVGQVAKENGFAKEERSLTFGVTLDQASIVRFFSCLNTCATPSAPIPFVGWPLQENERTEGEATVNVSESGVVVETRTERHATTVGTQAPVTVPAGTFDAFVVSWSRTIVDGQGNEETETAVLQWAPDVGIVKHDTFDGVTLELQSLE